MALVETLAMDLNVAARQRRVIFNHLPMRAFDKRQKENQRGQAEPDSAAGDQRPSAIADDIAPGDFNQS